MTEFEYAHYFATFQEALYWNTLNMFHKHVWFVSIGELYVRRLEICPGIPSYAVVELFDVCEKKYVNEHCNDKVSFIVFLLKQKKHSSLEQTINMGTYTGIFLRKSFEEWYLHSKKNSLKFT